MKHPTRAFAAALATLMTTASLTALGVTSATPAQADEVSVTEAELRWGLNNETNAAGYAPGTWNLMSAGLIDDPGQGGQTIRTADEGETWSNGKPAGWVNQEGNVTVEDLRAGGGYQPTTFDGTREDSAGTRTGVSNGVYAETEAVFRNGVGSYDPDAGTAEISWDGDLTVLFYSGMSFFYVSDPVLRVGPDGTGTVTATVDGFQTSMDDMTVWEPLDSAEVTIATLRNVDVSDAGFEVTPLYRKVKYDAPEGSSAQSRSGEDWGAFPSSFIDWVQQTGAGPYWYSTGGGADVRKPTLPLAVSFDGSPVDPGPAATRARVNVTKVPTTRRPGNARVRLTSAAGTPKGQVRVVVKNAKGKVVSRSGKKLQAGSATVALKKAPRGRYRLTATYPGNDRFGKVTKSATYRIKN